MKKLAIVIVIVLTGLSLNAQNYQYAAGIRFGLPFGITGKLYTSDNSRFEAIFSSGWGGAGLTGLFEVSSPTDAYDNLYWFYGAGLHAGVGDGSSPNPWRYGSADGVFGIDGIVGLEYRFDGHPFEVSVDWIPSFNLIGDFGFGAFQIGLSGRYLF